MAFTNPEPAEITRLLREARTIAVVGLSDNPQRASYEVSATLLDYGFAKGVYQARPDDGLKLVNCRISNAVRCVPPQNKPLPAEINTCRQFLVATIATMPKLRAIVALGRIAHESTLKALGLRSAAAPFGHGAVHGAGALRLYDSYHCSRYNTNTGVLTTEMFEGVFQKVRAFLDQS